MYYKTNYTSRLGDILLASDGENLIGLWFEDQKYFGGDIKEEIKQKDDLPVFDSAKAWLDRYFDGKIPCISELPLAPRGGEFRKAVWDILCKISYGKCLTYGDIARELAAKSGKASMSAQAVGGAVGHNPISIIIPCHRVVGSGGSLTGYAGGIAKKIELLKLEGVDISRFHVPK